MTRLSLFGCYHFNRRRIVAGEFRRVAGDADAVAVEYPVFDGVADQLRALLYAPIVFLGGTLLFVFFQGPLCLLLGRDVLSTECSVVLERAGDRDVHFVDRHPVEVLQERSSLWAVCNWLLLLGLFAYAPAATAALWAVVLGSTVVTTLRLYSGRRWIASALFAAVVLGALWILLTVQWAWAAALLVAVVTILILFVTAHDRNHAMLEECSRLAAAHGYDDVCLVTGKAHLPGIVEVVDSYELTVTDAFAQRFCRRGSFVEPDAVVEETSTMNLGVSVAPERTEGVLRRRALGAAVDGVVVLVASVAWLFVLAGAATAAFGPEASGLSQSATVAVAFAIAIALLALPVGYFVVQERRYGQTLGHRLAGVEVISLDGEALSRRQAVLRNIGRVVDFLPVGYLVGALVARSNDGSRRLGDLRAGTAVVRVADDVETADADPRGVETDDAETAAVEAD